MLKYLLIIIFSTNIFASDNLDVKLYFGGSYNLFQSNFKELPNVPNCCDNFSNGNGLGFEIGAGFDYLFDNKLFGIADYYSFGFIYKDFSGRFEKEVISGNLIREFGYEPAYSNISIDASLGYIFTSHYLNFSLLDFIKTDVFVNFDIGFATFGSYKQQEEAIRPNDYVFENGERIRDESSGSIDDFNSLYIGFGGGLKYNSINLGSFKLIPELNYRYSVLPVVNSIDWQASSISLGVSISDFNFGREKEPEIPPVPIIPAPEKPKDEPEVLPISAEIEIRSENLIDENLIEYTVNKTIYKDVYSLPAILYYRENEIEPMEFDLSTGVSKYGNQLDLLSSISKKIKDRGGDNITVVLSSSKDSTILFERMRIIKQVLAANNVPKQKIKDLNFKLNLISKEEFKYEELAEEAEKAEFVFEDKKLFEYKFKEYEKVNIPQPRSFEVNIRTNEVVTGINSNVNFLDKNVEFLNSKNITISESQLMDIYTQNAGKIKINSVAKSNDETKNISETLHLKEKINEKVIYNYQENTGESQYILGYFNFDESDFSNIDQKTVNKVKEALKKGKEVTLYPLTDNLGADNYNSTLSMARLQTALGLFANSEKIKTKIPDEPFFDNRHPFGRAMNRSIVVRIKN